MKRALIATVGTVAGMVALLDYKSSGTAIHASHVSVGGLGGVSLGAPGSPASTATGGVAIPAASPSTTRPGAAPSTTVPPATRTAPSTTSAAVTPTTAAASISPVTATAATSPPATSRPAVTASPSTAPPSTAPPATAPPTTSAPVVAKSYTGSDIQYAYGDIEVAITVDGGRITQITIPQESAPDARSAYINSQAVPILKQEALQAQGMNFDVVSGATYTSYAFAQSFQSALQQAGR